MSVTYGFYNSKDGDRRYDAIQMSSIFDGIIEDGVLQHVGTAMVVKESEAMTVNVGIGRAWFNHTWTLNDAILPLAVSDSEVLLNRYDAVVLEVDSREAIRANEIKIIKGTPASSPKKPTMLKTNDRWQYPLAYIYVGAGAMAIHQSDITNCVGTSECPYVTAPLDKISIDDMVAQWQDQWKRWEKARQSEFLIWFQGIRDILDDADASNIIQRILNMQNIEITLEASKWSNTVPYSQEVEITTLRSTDEVSIGKAAKKDTPSETIKLWDKMESCITAAEALNGKVVFYCASKKPTSDFKVRLRGISI